MPPDPPAPPAAAPAPRPTAFSDPALDDRAVARLRDAIGHARAASMYVRYLDDTEHQIAAIVAAAAIGNLETLHTHAHTLKGTSSNLGVSSCSNHAAAIVTACLDGRLDDAVGLAQDIDSTFRVAEVAIRHRLIP